MSAQIHSRRRFLQGLGLGAFTLAIGSGRLLAASATRPLPADFVPNAFIRIDGSGRITVISSYLEMGQGTFTGLATLAAEELDVSLDMIDIVPAEADVHRYANPVFAKIGMHIQGTGGSSAMAGAWSQMRQAAASARLMLVTAAAQQWRVAVTELDVEQGVIVHRVSGRRLKYAEIASRAALLPVPTAAPVKQPQAFKLIGQASDRIDAPAKLNGSARYTQDVQLPEMLVAVVAYPPRRWSTPRHVDSRAALQVPGVKAVVVIPGDKHVQAGVAVLARNTWVAQQGREALSIDWDTSSAMTLDSDQLFARFRHLAAQPGNIAVHRGQAIGQVPAGGKVFEAIYEQPYLSHAPMEPMNCVIRVNADGCELWNGEQWQTGDQAAIAQELGIKPSQVKIHQLYAGGSFGRRANMGSDYVRTAVRIVKGLQQQGIDAPVKLVWLREDDIHAMQYRPQTVHRVQAISDANGHLVSWDQIVVGQSFMPLPSPTAIDASLVEGSADGHYAIPQFRVMQHVPDDVPVPVTFLRSVGHTHTAFVVETMIDEVAVGNGQDPYRFRRQMLAQAPRLVAVLDKVIAMAAWSQPLPAGPNGTRRARGLALHESFGSYVAQVAEITMLSEDSFSVDRVFCAIDCGTAINPDLIRAQMEGGIAFGLGFLMHGITIRNGQIQQSNFNDYPLLRINAMPVVEVAIMPSEQAPSGVGEPGVPPIAPAVVNALAAATGQRYRKLPLSPQLRML